MTKFVLLLDWEGFEKDKYVHTVLEDNLLPEFLAKCSWFGANKSSNWRLKISNIIRMSHKGSEYFFATLRVTYSNSEIENYLITLSFVESQELLEENVISAAMLDDKEGYLVEGIHDEKFREALYFNMANNLEFEQKGNGSLNFVHSNLAGNENYTSSSFPIVQSSNTAVVFGEKYFFKLYRKLFRDTNPEVEMVQFISQNSDFKNIPKFFGSVSWSRPEKSDVTLGLMVELIQSDKDNWSQTGDYLNDFLFAFVEGNFQVKENVFEKVALLGKRTAEMHLALHQPTNDENFRSERFERSYRRYIHEKVESLLENRYELLTAKYMELDEPAQKLAWNFMESKDIIMEFLDQILTRPINSVRIRNHGDYNLKQVLVANDDFVIIDFEGEPDSAMANRKIKHSPLKDVAGMIRSYHYAVSAKLYNSLETKSLDSMVLQRASDRWYKLMYDTFLQEYIKTLGLAHPLLHDNNEINYLLQFHLLEKSAHELGYELNHRMDWVKIPLKGLNDVILEIEKLNK